MTYQNRAIAALCGFAEHEGLRYGDADIALACAEVIGNRVRAGWGEWLEVIANAPSVAGTLYPEPWRVNPRAAAWQKLMRGIDDLYHDGAPENMTGGALYFCNLNQIDRAWFEWHIVHKRAEHPIIGTVGPLTFFG